MLIQSSTEKKRKLKSSLCSDGVTRCVLQQFPDSSSHVGLVTQVWENPSFDVFLLCLQGFRAGSGAVLPNVGRHCAGVTACALGASASCCSCCCLWVEMGHQSFSSLGVLCSVPFPSSGIFCFHFPRYFRKLDSRYGKPLAFFKSSLSGFPWKVLQSFGCFAVCLPQPELLLTS